MTKIEMIGEAIQSLPDASTEELVTFVEEKYGEKIDMRFVPIFTASIRDKMQLAAKRRERAAIAKS